MLELRATGSASFKPSLPLPASNECDGKAASFSAVDDKDGRKVMMVSEG